MNAAETVQFLATFDERNDAAEQDEWTAAAAAQAALGNGGVARLTDDELDTLERAVRTLKAARGWAATTRETRDAARAAVESLTNA